MDDVITYERRSEGYGVIKLNRPEKRNAISIQMAKLLKEKLEIAEREPLKFLVITGADNGMFSAGGDLKDLHGELSSEDAFQRLFQVMEILRFIVNFPVPVIAQLNGNALGGGCELATACDLRIAKEHTKFGFIQTNIGILPGWGGGALLYRKVHPSFALDWITRGVILSAEELREKGWLHQVIGEADWDKEEYFIPYIEKSVEQMRLLKTQYKANLQMEELSRIMVDEVKSSASLWKSEAHKAALEKFSQRKS